MNRYKTVKLNTARNALRYVIKAFNIKEIYIPYYICPAIRSAVFKEECKVNFYHIDINFKPVFDFPENAYILYPNYFGVCTLIAEELSKKYKNLIVDNAHSFFSEPIGIASFNSVRKFFPQVRDGAFLYTKKTIDIKIEKDIYKYNNNELSYEELCKNESRLDKENIKYMSDCSYKYLINIEEQKQMILAHFNKYKKLFDAENILKYELKEQDVPYKYPLLLANEQKADNIAKLLEKEGIAIFKYWNNLPDSFSEKIFYTKLVAI